MKTISKLIVLFILGLTFTSHACDINGETGFFPKNDMSIPVNSKMSNNMTKADFDKVISKIEMIYSPIVKELGKRLKVHRKWASAEVNAKAYPSRSRQVLHVEMYGGLARHRKNSADGFTMVLCHELGHHLGGAPRKGNSWWASNEGQSDYWAALKCFRKFARNDDNEKIVSKMTIPSIVKTTCEANFSTADDINICLRSSMAALDLGKVLNDLRKEKRIVKFSTPHSKVVRKTDDSHPASQCRLDTMYQGSICHISDDIKVSHRDANIGSCNRVDNHEDGLRPLCWFKPRK